VLVARRWRRYGQDRLYIKTSDGQQVGSVDLRSGQRTYEVLELADDMDLVVDAALAADPSLTASNGTPPPAPISPPPLPLAPAPKPTRRRRSGAAAVPGDLADQTAGQGAAARAEQLAARHPVASRLARLVGLRTSDWAWRVGAAGERKVGRKLDQLARSGKWRVLHSVPLGRGGDIDHLLIGPAGVFTVNTKRHKGKHVRVGRSVVFVGRSQTDHVLKARREAQRVAEALAAALGRHVPVSALLICTGQRSLRGWLRHAPLGVQVLPARWAKLWLRFPGRGALTPAEVEQVYAVARRAATYGRA